MAFQDYDELTGMPKRLGTNTGYATPMLSFATTGTGTSGATGYNASTTGTGTQTGGGQSWDDFIKNDPYYQQAMTDLNAQGISNLDQAQSAARQGIVRFGEAPTNLDPSVSSWIDDTTRQLAQQNTAAGTSAVARLQKMNSDRVRAIKNSLAAKGGLQSGDLGYYMGENQQQYTNAQYDARTQLMDYIASIQKGYLEGQRQIAAARSGAVNNVAARAPAPGSGTAAPPPVGNAGDFNPIANMPKEWIANEPVTDPAWLAEQKRQFALRQSYQSGRGL